CVGDVQQYFRAPMRPLLRRREPQRERQAPESGRGVKRCEGPEQHQHGTPSSTEASKKLPKARPQEENMARGDTKGASSGETPMPARTVGGHVELPEEEARSGRTGFHVRYILIFSTILVAAGIGLAAIFASVAH